jgi:hypothetical protein
MKRAVLIVLLVLTTLTGPAVYSQQDKEANRVRTREMLAQLLEKAGPDLKCLLAKAKNNPLIMSGR